MKNLTASNPPIVLRPSCGSRVLCLAALLALVGTGAQAQLTSSESFNSYTVGTQLPANTPSPTVSGYSGDWTGVDFGTQRPSTIAGSLSYGGAGYAAGTGNQIGVPNNTSGGEITSANSGRMYRLLDSTLKVDGTTTGVRYLSWLFQSGHETGNTTYQMLELYNGSTADAARAFAAGLCYSASPGDQYDFQVNSASVNNGTGVAADTGVHLFVVKFNLSATAGADSVTVWIDPTLGAGEPAGGTTISGQNLAFDRLSISDYDGNSAKWDEVRWGTSFDGVTITAPPAPPSVTAVANPSAASANKSFTVTATVTPGAGAVTNISINLSQVGGPASTNLVLSSGNVYTNTFTVAGSATIGAKTLTVSAMDTTPISATYALAFSVVPSSRTWDGGSLVDSKWSSITNWVGEVGPSSASDSVTFAGTTRLTPDMDANYSIVGLTFDATAGSFNLGSTTGSTLTNGLGGITNLSANAQVVNVPIVLGAAQAFSAGTGSLTFSNTFTGGQSLTKTGNGTVVFAGSGASSVGDFIVTNGLLKVAAGSVKATTTQGNSKVDLGATLEVSGGTLSVASGNNAWYPIGDTAATTSTLTLSGGTMNVTNNWGIQIGRNGSGVLNLTSGTLYVKDIGGQGVSLAESAGVTGTVNLDGGSLVMNRVRGNAGTGYFYFNGGTVKPTESRTDFIPNMATVTTSVRNGGAVVDTAGFNVAIADYLEHSAVGGDNANDGGLTKVGNGTLTLSGGFAYTGPTRVLGGTLSLNPSLGVPATGNDLTVSNATLLVDASSGSALPVANLTVRDGAALVITNNPGASGLTGSGNLTLSGGTTITLDYGVLGGNPSAAAINVAGSLTASGANVINIVASGTLTVGQFPLIDYTGTAVPTNNFVLGSLPPGVTAVLTNNADNTSLDLLITLIGNTLSWHGANSDNSVLLTDWDINTSANWYDPGFSPSVYQQYNGNTIGDKVSFGDNGFNLDGTNAVNLAGRVVPSLVTADNNNYPYTLTGTGGIDGNTSFTKNGANTFLIGTSNNYTGGTVINAGTLAVANKSALGSGSVTLAGGTLQLAANITNANAVTVTVNSTLEAPAGVIAQMSGAITGAVNVARTGSGSLTLAGNVAVASLTKSDNGTLTLSGTSTTTAAAQVAGGTLNLTGSATPGYTTVGSASGDAVATISGTLTTSNLFVGNVSGAVGIIRQTGGTVTLAGGAGDRLNLGNWDSTYGYYNAAGGTLNTKGISIGGGRNSLTGQPWPPVGADANGLMEINGATIQNDTGWVVLARGSGNNLGVLNLFSGSLSYADGGIGCNWQQSGASQTSIINVIGGTLTNAANVGINLNMWNGAGRLGILNLNGGLVQANGIGGTPGIVNFNGGTLRAGADNTAFVNVGAIFVHGGGATIDDGGKAITIGNPLLAPTGYGVSGISLTDGGSGYIAPPIVTLTGGTGSNATAIATIAGGTVTGITVTSPGSGYDVSDVLTVNFTGGGATAVTPTVGTVSLVANTSGGLTKTGNGTLTLNGISTYTGPTKINAGTLAGTGTIAGALTNNATLAPGTNGIGALTINGNITLKAGSTNLFSVNGSTPANTAVVAGGNVTYGGVLKIAPSGAFTAGQQFQLFSGTGAINPGNFASLEGSPGSGLAFSFTNGVLSVVATMAQNPTNITVSVSGNTLTLTWPQDHLGWILQAQTNNLTTGLGANWVDVPGSQSSTTNVITINPADPAVFYRLSKP